MPDTIYYIPIYKTCETCDGSESAGHMPDFEGGHDLGCANCNNEGIVRVLIPLDEFAKEIDLSEEATHNLMCCVRDA